MNLENHPFFCENEEQKETPKSLDAIMGELITNLVDKFLVDLKEELLAIKKAELELEQKSITSNEYMTRKEVMELLKRCDSTMSNWVRTGYLVPVSVGGKHLYRKSDVMKLMK